MAISRVVNWLEGPTTAIKEYGAWRGCTATVLSSGFTSTTTEALKEVVDDIEANVLAIGAEHPYMGNLLLKSITPKVRPDATTIESTLEFVPVAEYDGVGILMPETTLQQEQTEKDRLGNTLGTSHTYPSTDINFPGITVPQGGRVSVDEPQFILRATLKKQIKFPIEFSSSWLNHVNAGDWQGGGHETWKCIECNPVPLDVSTTPWTYMVHFAFQKKNSGWQPSVVFTDPTTGEPPANLVAGVGYKSFYWYYSRDFGELFPSAE